FEDIVQSAYSQADKSMLEGILPFPASAQMDFNMSYLSGFLAKKRDIERDALEGDFKSKLLSYSNSILRGTVGSYSSFTIKNNNVRIKACHWDYSLMPIWLLTYKSKKGKVFTFAINGHTGKIYGELPIDAKKVTLSSILTGLGVGLLAFLGGLLLL
ncbi:MAG: TFIIB-type zinc ribbon-containing protein, partial [Clostridia bacterium]|nr:TFIIB-type zinc ribbon-containing protein [Clostridia bacterium]